MMYRKHSLACDPARLAGLSERLITEHYESHYVPAVDPLNQILARLEEMDFERAPAYLLNGIKRVELNIRNAIALHELYFASLGASEPPPESSLFEEMARGIGSLARWGSEFKALGRAVGSMGWVVLTYWPRDGGLFNQWASEDTQSLAGGVPLLAMDLHEHAYYMDFGTRVPAYVDAFMANINWANVARLYQEAAARPRPAQPSHEESNDEMGDT